MNRHGRTGCGRGPLAAGAALACALLALPAAAAQMSLETFGNLRRGMPESEVLLRAGSPDLVLSPFGDVVVLGEGIHGPEVRELHYLPDASEHDPQLTVVTIRRGRVSALERRKILAPPSALRGAPPAGPEAPQDPPRGDLEVLRERADRTLDAAERYSEVRARIKARGGEPSAGKSPVYRGVDAAGAPYFGDVPPAAPEAAAQ